MYEAIEAMAGKLSFTQLNGQTVYIEVVGVYPPSYQQLLDYIKDAVAYQLVKAGALVLDVPRSVDDLVLTPPSEASYKVVIAVQEAGVDIWSDNNIFIKKKYVQGKVAIKVTAYPIRSGSLYQTTASAEGRQRIVHHTVLGWSQPTDYTATEQVTKGGIIMKAASIAVPLALILFLL